MVPVRPGRPGLAVPRLVRVVGRQSRRPRPTASCSPAYQKTTWTWDDDAEAWYHHRFYDFQPDLNWANPDVRAEMAKVVGVLAAARRRRLPHGRGAVRDRGHPARPQPSRSADFAWLDEFRAHLSWRRGDAVVLAEANVERDELLEYFGDGDRLPMLFNFAAQPADVPRVGPADGRADRARRLRPMPVDPRHCRGRRSCATTTRSTSRRLSRTERARVLRRVRSRAGDAAVRPGHPAPTGPMLGGDRRRIELAYALAVHAARARP